MLDHQNSFDFVGTQRTLLDSIYADMTGCSIGTNARTGTHCLRMDMWSNDVGFRKVLNHGARDRVGIAAAWYFSQLPSNNEDTGIYQWRDGANRIKATIILESTGCLAAWSGGMNTFYGGGGTFVQRTSRPVIFPQAFQHIEAANGSSGLEVRVDGVTVLNLENIDKYEGETAQVKIGSAGYPLMGAIGLTADIDDLRIWNGDGDLDNDFGGDLKLFTAFLDSDGAVQDWIPSRGSSAFPLLSNAPPVDAWDYIQAAAPSGSPPQNQRSVFGVQNFPDSIVAVRAVSLMSRMWKTDAGDVLVSVGVGGGGNEYTSEPRPLASRPAYYEDVFDRSPVTATVWSLADINNMSTLVERVEG